MARIRLQNLNDFFNTNTINYKVPIYQRKYTWEEQDCKSFFLDIYKWHEKIKSAELAVFDEYYFAGSIITYIDKNRINSIVDGQQRITTTMLILCALKYHLHKDGKDTSIVDDMIFSKSYEIGNEKKKKLKLNNPNNDNILLKISELNINGIDENNLLLKNFNCLVEEIEKIKKINSNYSIDIIDSLKFVILSHVILNENDNPTEIFETINTTGKKLSAADMIRNYIFFYSYKFPEKEDELSKKYDLIEELLYVNKDKNKPEKQRDSDLMMFYRYFNNIISGLKLAKKDSDEIFRDFKVIYNSEFFTEYNNVCDVIELIHKHAWVWNIIHNYEFKEKIDIYYYNSFKDSIYTYYSLVHQLVFDKVQKNEKGEYFIDDKFFRNIVRIISKLMFSLLISGKTEKNITRDIPNIYKNFKESNSQNFEDWMIERSKENIDISILDKEGIAKHINNTNIYTLSSKKTKFLLYGIEGMLDNWEIEIKKIDDFSVEHISPQNPSRDSDYFEYAMKINENNEIDAEKYLENIKHKLPNLTLVVGTTNSELSNKSYKEKLKIYNEKTFLSINKELSKYEEWTKESLSKRADWYVEMIDRLFNECN